jgi:hypothetical protein
MRSPTETCDNQRSQAAMDHAMTSIRKLGVSCERCRRSQAVVVEAGTGLCGSCRPRRVTPTTATRTAAPTGRHRGPTALSTADAARATRLEVARMWARASDRRAAAGRTDADRSAELRRVAQAAGVRLPR